MRKQLVYDIVNTYVYNMTSAEMADRLSQVESERKEANEWFTKKRKELSITSEEIREALESVIKDREERQTACFYDMDVLK